MSHVVSNTNNMIENVSNNEEIIKIPLSLEVNQQTTNINYVSESTNTNSPDMIKRLKDSPVTDDQIKHLRKKLKLDSNNELTSELTSNRAGRLSPPPLLLHSQILVYTEF